MNAGSPADQTFDDVPAGPFAETRGRLWTPWRMRYISGGDRPAACIFCHHLAATDDVRNLILHRGRHAMVIMNLFPYNTGHLMLIPNHHVGSPEQAADADMIELAQLRGPMLRALRRALSCHAFNLGLNVGAEAGAGISEHLHEHIVPRWAGDANFMPIVANTSVLPELLPVTYAKVRAEATRELHGDSIASAVIFDAQRSMVVVDGKGQIPRIEPEPGVALWRTAQETMQTIMISVPQLAGWAGSPSARDATVGFAFVTPGTDAGLPPVADGWQWLAVREALAGPDGAHLDAARSSLLKAPGDPQS